jgi:hypothetical protein
MNKKLNDKYIKEMDKCFELDEENGHIEADGVLCDLLMTLGYEDVVNKFYELDKWYS